MKRLRRLLNFIIFTSIFTIGFSTHAIEPDSECINWFKAGKIKTENKSCEIACTTLMVDMETSMCPNQCKELCRPSRTTWIPSKYIYYPGLNQTEKKLVEQYPKDAITVFIQKTRAEIASETNFPTQGLNDEGDAFRHFIWAGLLMKELGKEKALKFLSAHEENRLQPENEKIMDSSNNRSGIEAAQNLINENKFNIENLEQKGLDALIKKHLNVINPGLPIPLEPK